MTTIWFTINGSIIISSWVIMLAVSVFAIYVYFTKRMRKIRTNNSKISLVETDFLYHNNEEEFESTFRVCTLISTSSTKSAHKLETETSESNELTSLLGWDDGANVDMGTEPTNISML